MSESYDLVVVGAGHNGLIAAGYLAKAGLKTLVLDRNAYVGGGTSTAELVAPGFRHDLHSSVHTFIQANPLLVNDELQLLSRHGLRYIYPDAIYATLFADQTSIVTYRSIDKSCASIAAISPRDAEAYRGFVEASKRALPMIIASLFVPPAPQGPFWALLDQSAEGRDLMGILQRSVLDLVGEWFTHEKVILHLLKFVSEALVGPEEKGTGIMLFTMPGLLHTYGPGLPETGSGALADALIRCLDAHGGTLRLNADVKKILTHGGRAVGIELNDGEVIAAKSAVLATLHPHLLERFVDGLDARVARNAKRVQPSAFSHSASHFALRAPPRYHAGAAGEAFLVGLAPNTLEQFRRAFDSFRYGEIPDPLLMSVLVNSRHDPTRAPPGQATLTLWTHLPYRLKNGGADAWDAQRDSLNARVLEYYRRFTTNVDDASILGTLCHTPRDMVRSSPSFQEGDNVGAGPYFYQFGGHRPTPELSGYTVPGIDRLFLTGPFMHPGGGVFGGGRATAIKMCEVLGLDFDRLTT